MPPPIAKMPKIGGERKFARHEALGRRNVEGVGMGAHGFS
jgi:hypothetical protein